MAKKTKEAGLPVIIALVFFVLISVGLGVFTYTVMSEQAADKAAVAEAKKKETAARGLVTEAEQKLKVYRIAIGIDKPDDRTTLLAETKGGDPNAIELNEINEAVAKRIAQAAAADKAKGVPATELLNWAPDAENRVAAPPTRVLLDGIVKAYSERELAKADAEKQKQLYDAAVKTMADAAAKLGTSSGALDTTATEVRKQITTDLAKIEAAAAQRAKQFQAELNTGRKRVEEFDQETSQAKTKIVQMTEEIKGLKLDIEALQGKLSTRKQDQFAYDDPQGRVTRRVDDATVEIDLGSADKARPGLTFTVLPADYPEKGYQSRVRAFRVPDDKGRFVTVERFVEKANIEIIEVLGPNLSRARIVPGSEDALRDRIMPGDRLYNVVWRRGYSEHIALFGLFDVNGDGTDDLPTLVKDLTRMGITVDAYFDLRGKKWVGTITERTRYAVEGMIPLPTGSTDPFAQAKTEMIGEVSKARDQAKQKGISVVPYRDFFPRMGYKVKADITDAKINQAAAPYLQGVIQQDAPPPPPN